MGMFARELLLGFPVWLCQSYRKDLGEGMSEEEGQEASQKGGCSYSDRYRRVQLGPQGVCQMELLGNSVTISLRKAILKDKG